MGLYIYMYKYIHICTYFGGCIFVVEVGGNKICDLGSVCFFCCVLSWEIEL